MGSVVLLWGEPGDLIVDFAHLKQPVETFGPHQVLHDHEHGTSTLYHQADLLTSLREAENGLIVSDAARLMFGEEKPDRNQIERARRRLNGYVESSYAERRDDPDGLARYFHRENAA